MSDNSYKQASAQMAGIAEMVAAMNCDFDRLEELRDEKTALVTELEDAVNGAEGAKTREEAEGELAEWIEENGDELKELEDVAGEFENAEQARERINEDPLSIELTGKWSLGETPTADGFEILLCTGGPAVRIKGDLNHHGEPCRAWLEYQDWGTPWQEFYGENFDMDTLLAYCREFYFGEG